MINIITGKPGSGKTTYLAKLVKDEFLPKGIEVWSYKKLQFADPRVKYFNNIHEIRKLNNAVIILDEAQIWFNARKWDELDEDLQYALQQHRHRGIDLWGAVQNLKRLDVVVRELVANYYEIQKLAGTELDTKFGKLPKNPWGIYEIHKYEPEEANKKERSLLKIKWFLAGKKLYNYFDTKVNYEEEFLEKHGNKVYTKMLPVKICPICNSHRLIWSSYRTFK